MPSEFFKDRYNEQFPEVFGTETVSYFVFSSDSKDEVTGTIDDSVAYPETPVKLTAAVDMQPSKAMREKIGLEIDYVATIESPVQEFESHSIEPKNGDAVILPGLAQKYFVKKVFKKNQSGDKYLDYVLAVGRREGSR